MVFLAGDVFIIEIVACVCRTGDCDVVGERLRTGDLDCCFWYFLRFSASTSCRIRADSNSIWRASSPKSSSALALVAPEGLPVLNGDDLLREG